VLDLPQPARLQAGGMDLRTYGRSRAACSVWFVMTVFLPLPSLDAHEPLTIDVLAASRALWPREVTVNVAHEVPLLVNGKVSGSMQASPGRVYPVRSIEPDKVVVDAMGSLLTFPPADTDIFVRAETVRTRLEAIATARAAATPQAIQSPPSTASRPTPAAPTNKIVDRLTGKLVIYNGSSLERLEASALKGKKYLAVYFSASWCGPCRKFTPRLVDWYNGRKAQLDQFDVIFVSQDNSKEEMLEYMKQERMPWPALKFANASSSPLEKYSGRGIPCLVVIDQQGKVLSHSYKGDEYLGPSKVIKDLEGLLAAE
jgi:nucleoredoxin